MTLEMTLAAKELPGVSCQRMSRGELGITRKSVHSNESLYARSSNWCRASHSQVLRGEGYQSEAPIQLADENQPSVRRDPIP